MSVDGGEFAGLSPRDRSYLARLESIFPSLDPRVIRHVIEQKTTWTEIVEALLSPNIAESIPPPASFPDVARSQDPKMFMLVQNHKRTKRSDIPIDVKSTRYDSECLLYLPPEIACLDMDLETFGLFDDAADSRFRTPYGAYGRDVAGPLAERRT